MTDLLATLRPPCTVLVDGLVLLAGFADADALHGEVGRIAAAAPFRHLTTPGGGTMSVAMTNCGSAGWVSDRRGYRYTATDPLTGRAWPAMPAAFADLADRAARAAGFDPFAPDACLVNRYAPGTTLGAHQDKDEADFAFPIVSVSIGLPAVFAWYGATRGGTPLTIPLQHGDVVVFGGPARRGYHGVRRLKPGRHPLTGDCRVNLTFRRALP
ncbi:MAG: DNA oxidative demethylase AlkB [Alphaproteobacteria bacterium]